MIKVLYFLEDRAQESFITSLVNRVALEESVSVEHKVLSAFGGSRSFKKYEDFVIDIKERRIPFEFDLIVVGIDANCKKYSQRLKEVRSVVLGTGFEHKLICCIPDPHIERWYLLDTSALKSAVGKSINVSTPQYKCEKDYYKKQLGSTLSQVGALLGGPDYAEKIVQNINFKTLADQNAGFGDFISELRRCMRQVCDG